MFQVQMTCELSYGSHERQKINVCVPQTGKQEAPLVLCFHSGWFQFGQAETLQSIQLALAKHGFASASIAYRYISEVSSLHDIVDDCQAGIKTAIEEAELLGADCKRPALLGSGVGGLLATNIAIKNPGTYSALINCGGTPQLTPWQDASPAIKQALQSFKTQEAETVQVINKDCSQLPPVLILHGDTDPEVPVTLAREFHARCIDAGVQSTFSVLNGTKHRFIEDSSNRAAKSAYKNICEWLEQRFVEDHGELSCGDPSFLVPG